MGGIEQGRIRNAEFLKEGTLLQLDLTAPEESTMESKKTSKFGVMTAIEIVEVLRHYLSRKEGEQEGIFSQTVFSQIVSKIIIMELLERCENGYYDKICNQGPQK